MQNLHIKRVIYQWMYEWAYDIFKNSYIVWIYYGSHFHNIYYLFPRKYYFCYHFRRITDFDIRFMETSNEIEYSK